MEFSTAETLRQQPQSSQNSLGPKTPAFVPDSYVAQERNTVSDVHQKHLQGMRTEKKMEDCKVQ